MTLFWKMLLLCSFAILSHNVVSARPTTRMFPADLTSHWPSKSSHHETWSKSIMSKMNTGETNKYSDHFSDSARDESTTNIWKMDLPSANDGGKGGFSKGGDGELIDHWDWVDDRSEPGGHGHIDSANLVVSGETTVEFNVANSDVRAEKPKGHKSKKNHRNHNGHKHSGHITGLWQAEREDMFPLEVPVDSLDVVPLEALEVFPVDELPEEAMPVDTDMLPIHTSDMLPVAAFDELPVYVPDELPVDALDVFPVEVLTEDAMPVDKDMLSLYASHELPVYVLPVDVSDALPVDELTVDMLDTMPLDELDVPDKLPLGTFPLNILEESTIDGLPSGEWPLDVLPSDRSSLDRFPLDMFDGLPSEGMQLGASPLDLEDKLPLDMFNGLLSDMLPPDTSIPEVLDEMPFDGTLDVLLSDMLPPDTSIPDALNMLAGLPSDGTLDVVGELLSEAMIPDALNMLAGLPSDGALDVVGESLSEALIPDVLDMLDELKLDGLTQDVLGGLNDALGVLSGGDMLKGMMDEGLNPVRCVNVAVCPLQGCLGFNVTIKVEIVGLAGCYIDILFDLYLHKNLDCMELVFDSCQCMWENFAFTGMAAVFQPAVAVAEVLCIVPDTAVTVINAAMKVGGSFATVASGGMMDAFIQECFYSKKLSKGEHMTGDGHHLQETEGQQEYVSEESVYDAGDESDQNDLVWTEEQADAEPTEGSEGFADWADSQEAVSSEMPSDLILDGYSTEGFDDDSGDSEEPVGDVTTSENIAEYEQSYDSAGDNSGTVSDDLVESDLEEADEAEGTSSMVYSEQNESSKEYGSEGEVTGGSTDGTPTMSGEDYGREMFKQEQEQSRGDQEYVVDEGEQNQGDQEYVEDYEREQSRGDQEYLVGEMEQSQGDSEREQSVDNVHNGGMEGEWGGVMLTDGGSAWEVPNDY